MAPTQALRMPPLPRRRMLVACGIALCVTLAFAIGALTAPVLSPQQVERLAMQAPTVPAALIELRAAAGHGHPVAQRALANLLLTGADPSQYAEGVKLAELAAQQGEQQAGLLLGQACFYGRAGQPDYACARLWFQRVAQQRSSQGQYWLGLLYKGGYGVSRDPAQAVKWFQAAAAQGHADAMFMLGNAWQNGEGVAIDLKQARHWFQAAAEQEHPLATQSLASLQLDPALRAHLLQDVGEDPVRPKWLAR